MLRGMGMDAEEAAALENARNVDASSVPAPTSQGWLDTLNSAIKGVASVLPGVATDVIKAKVLDVGSKVQAAAGISRTPAAAPSAGPTWVKPVAVGGALLAGLGLLYVVMRKKGK